MKKIKKFRLPRKLKKIYKDPIRFERLLRSKGFTGYSNSVVPFYQRCFYLMNFGNQYVNSSLNYFGF